VDIFTFNIILSDVTVSVLTVMNTHRLTVSGRQIVHSVDLRCWQQRLVARHGNPSLATVPPTVATIDIINIHDVYGSDRLSNISRSFIVIIASITIARYTACALAWNYKQMWRDADT